MAAERATSGTLVINTVADVNFPQYFTTITVVHRGTTGTVWVRTDGVEPSVLADDNYPVLPGQAVSFPNGILTQQPINRVISGTQMQMISDTAVPYTVYAV
jgi:hypothetical protein